MKIGRAMIEDVRGQISVVDDLLLVDRDLVLDRSTIDA